VFARTSTEWNTQCRMKPSTLPDPKRSALMSRVRQRGTAPEIRVATVLRQLGIAYRLNVRSLPGSPDFANRKNKWVIFVHGCFWHHHTACKRATVPTLNARFWRDKFLANRNRDSRAIQELRRHGYKVVVIWECQVEDTERLRWRFQHINKINVTARPPRERRVR